MRHGFIWYRFAHETEESFKRLPFGSESVNVPDLKILIAQVTGLEKEFTRAFDLRLCLVVDEGNGETDKKLEELNDAQAVLSESRIVVQRVAWTERPVIQHEARTELPSSAWKEPTIAAVPKEKLPLHQEFVCPICSQVLNNPVVARCSGRCRKSACRQCIEDMIKDDRICPFCSGRVQNVIPNKALAAIISQLHLEDYDVPAKSKSVPDIKMNDSLQPKEDIQHVVQQGERLPADGNSPIAAFPASAVKPALHDGCGALDVAATSTPQNSLHETIDHSQAASVAALLANPLLKNLGAALAKRPQVSSTTLTTSKLETPESVSQGSSDAGLDVSIAPSASGALLASQTFPRPAQPPPVLSASVQCDVAPPISQAQPVHVPKAAATGRLPGALDLLHALSHKRAQGRQPAPTASLAASADRVQGPNVRHVPSQASTCSALGQAAPAPPPRPKSLAPDDDMGPPLSRPKEVIERHKRARQYEFDELTNSWRAVATSDNLESAKVPAVKRSRQQGAESSVASNADFHQRCPFTIDELASKFPFLARESFLRVREFQQRVKATLEASHSQ